MAGLSSTNGASNCSGHKGAAEFAVVGCGVVDRSARFGAGFVGVI